MTIVKGLVLEFAWRSYCITGDLNTASLKELLLVFAQHEYCIGCYFAKREQYWIRWDYAQHFCLCKRLL